MNFETQQEWDNAVAKIGRLWPFIQEVHGAIRKALDRGRGIDVISQSERLKSAYSLAARVGGLATEIDRLSSGDEHSGTNGAPVMEQQQPIPESETPQKKARDRGEAARKDYVQRQERAGNPLTPFRGALYKRPNGTVVGIAYASERNRLDWWFLGLPKGSFSEAVLLCERANGTVMAVSLPVRFLNEYGGRLKGSKVGQTHFVVERKHEKAYLNVPAVGLVDVSGHTEGYNRSI